MTNQEKIDKAMVLIRRCGIENKRTTSDEVYELMRNYTLDDLAEELEMFINLVYGIRAVLEGE